MVDEFHLFNKQESLVFRYLLRDTRTTAHVAVALDPRQSPGDSYIGAIASGDSRVASVFGSNVREHVLDRVYRYTKQIDDVVRSLEEQWVFDLGSDWGFSHRVASLTGPLPSCVNSSTRAGSLAGAIQRAIELGTEGRTAAVLCLSTEAFAEAERSLSAGQRRKCVVLRSRDDAAAVESTGKKFVLSQPEYVAGLQFYAVLIPDASQARVARSANRPNERRRVWSTLYLAMSRARSELRFGSSDDEHGYLDLLGPRSIED